MSTRYHIQIDDYYEHDECDGGPMPMTPERYAGNEYYKDDGKTMVPYDEYVNYQGNPDRHVVLIVTREDECPCCGEWVEGGSLCGIDFMDDNEEANFGGWPGNKRWTLDQLKGYLVEVAKDLEPNERLIAKLEAK